MRAKLPDHGNKARRPWNRRAGRGRRTHEGGDAELGRIEAETGAAPAVLSVAAARSAARTITGRGTVRRRAGNVPSEPAALLAQLHLPGTPLGGLQGLPDRGTGV